MTSREQLLRQVATIRHIYYAIVGSILAVTLGIYYLVESGSMGPPDYDKAVLLQQVALFAIPAFMAIAYFVFKFLISKVAVDLSLTEKLRMYLTFLIIRSGLLEVAFLFCCAAALITREVLFIWITPAILFVFLLLRPTTGEIARDLKLSDGEKNQLEE